jgi:hypothetical protein
MVVTCFGPTVDTGFMPARVGTPLRCTVQAPQPNLVPTRPSVSRSTQSSGVSGVTSMLRVSPLMFSVYLLMGSGAVESRMSSS